MITGVCPIQVCKERNRAVISTACTQKPTAQNSSAEDQNRTENDVTTAGGDETVIERQLLMDYDDPSTSAAYGNETALYKNGEPILQGSLNKKQRQRIKNKQHRAKLRENKQIANESGQSELTLSDQSEINGTNEEENPNLTPRNISAEIPDVSHVSDNTSLEMELTGPLDNIQNERDSVQVMDQLAVQGDLSAGVKTPPNYNAQFKPVLCSTAREASRRSEKEPRRQEEEDLRQLAKRYGIVEK